MRLLLVGFGGNGEHALRGAISAGCTPAVVLVPAGFECAAMRDLATDRGIPLHEVGDLNGMEPVLRDLAPDLMVVASYPRLLAPSILGIPPLGTLNVHTSLLPRWRGIHPLNWALIHGDTEMGVTVHFMDQGMDSGDIVEQAVLRVGILDDIVTMRDRLTARGGELLAKALTDLAAGRVRRVPQDHSGATAAPRRRPADSRLDWSRDSRDVFNFCRALYEPYPNAFSSCRNSTVRVERVPVSDAPGLILARCGSRDYVVATGDGTVFVRLDRDDLEPGDRLA